MSRLSKFRWFASALTAGVVLGACSALPAAQSAPGPNGGPANFVAHGSLRQLWFTGAAASTPAELFRNGVSVAHARTDAAGSLIFRNLAPGDNYIVQVGSGSTAMVTTPVRVMRDDERPAASFYSNQTIVDGYQYLTTRDGTQLAITVRLPGPIDQGPYPTVIEYSGYSPADPQNPQPSTLLASTLGYATVGVNIRGTGCSGGAFQFFENLQSQDGYDVVETIAAQPWVLHNKVGMVGISYPAIAQLFVAQTRPPHLAAIAPLSVIDETYAGTLYPGGILNTGFALGWADERQSDGQAAPGGGQGWATRQINSGDTTCLANQALRGQMPNVLRLAKMAKYEELITPIVKNDFQSVTTLDSLSPATFVHKINVPVFLAGAWDDEQTGPHFANMLDNFTSSPDANFTLINGSHTESLSAEVLVRWHEFLELYVARRVPQLPAVFRAVGPSVFAGILGPVQPFPADRFDPATQTYSDVLAQYQAEPAVRVLFENGAGCPQIAIGAPCPTYETSFTEWPPKQTQATKWYLNEGGTLSEVAPKSATTDHYSYSGDGMRRTFQGGTSELWYGIPALDWPAPIAGRAVAYETSALAANTVMAGTGRIDLNIGAAVPDIDLELTLTEVRADGSEYYVQTGWLRASHRKLDPARSNALRAVPTHREADAQPLPANGALTPVAVELMPFAHTFHAGSRIRVIVDVPGGSRPHWQFDIRRYGHPVDVTVGLGGVNPASITLPIIPGAAAGSPAALPPCPSLRGQPCRTYAPYSNG